MRGQPAVAWAELGKTEYNIFDIISIFTTETDKIDTTFYANFTYN